mgnify:CR=1 FL=1
MADPGATALALVLAGSGSLPLNAGLFALALVETQHTASLSPRAAAGILNSALPVLLAPSPSLPDFLRAELQRAAAAAAPCALLLVLNDRAHVFVDGDIRAAHWRSGALTALTAPSDGAPTDPAGLPLARGDRLLLVTPGVWNNLETDGIEETLLLEADPRRAAERLLARARPSAGDEALAALVVDCGRFA